jgi:hypothetical protein
VVHDDQEGPQGLWQAARVRLSTTTSCSGTSPPRTSTGCDSPTSPSIRRGRASSDICAVKDVCSRRIVGYSISDRMTAQLAVSALRSAVARRQQSRVVTVHSDRGGQFRSRDFRRVLLDAVLAGSMGRVASAGDNAAMESFFSLLQLNVLMCFFSGPG